MWGFWRTTHVQMVFNDLQTLNAGFFMPGFLLLIPGHFELTYQIEQIP